MTNKYLVGRSNLKVIIDNETKEFHSIWWDEKGIINAIDQRKLPFSFEIYQAKNLSETCFAIKEMVVRGAPLIGVTAAYGLLQAVFNFKETDFSLLKKKLKTSSSQLGKTRPTAVDLFNSLNRIEKVLDSTITVSENIKRIKTEVDAIVNETLLECKGIGRVGSILIPNKCSIMTICNAGALATVDFGTALAPIRQANEDGKKITVYVNETRPRIQGGRLTAWELYNERIEHYINADGAAGHLISQGKIDLVIVGADRIVRNGDIANKIGTYTLSVLCKEHNVPFYVAAPRSTFDLETKSGKEIAIEERSEIEVRTAMSIDNINETEAKRRIIHHPHSKNINPAFDITPAKNITGIITPEKLLEQPLEEAIRDFLG